VIWAAAKSNVTRVFSVTNVKLLNALNDLFRQASKLPGGTAGALRWESKTGVPFGSATGHLTKAIQMISRLQDIAKTQQLTQDEQQLINLLIKDLQSAINDAAANSVSADWAAQAYLHAKPI
jgi:hypothetical protein